MVVALVSSASCAVLLVNNCGASSRALIISLSSSLLLSVECILDEKSNDFVGVIVVVRRRTYVMNSQRLKMRWRRRLKERRHCPRQWQQYDEDDNHLYLMFNIETLRQRVRHLNEPSDAKIIVSGGSAMSNRKTATHWLIYPCYLDVGDIDSNQTDS
jgi:hypothetical protein